MREIYRNALSEVNAILCNSEENVLNKIPQKFITFVQKNMNQSYDVNLDTNREILDQNISNEAKSIIALVYRDYICSEDERSILIKNEIFEKQKEEEMKRKMYSIKW